MKTNFPALPASMAKQSTFKMWLHRENVLFSYLREEPVSNANVLRVSHAMVAFLFLISCSTAAPETALTCLAWFIITLYLCKKGGLK